MGKKKSARRGGTTSLGSPHGKPTGQEEPVTDTVMQVLARRVRNARKKLQKVSVIEGLLQEGQTLNEDQERVYSTKTPLTAVVDELVKLEPLVEAALQNELAEHVRSAQEEAERDEKKAVTPEATDTAPVTSDGGESDATEEGVEVDTDECHEEQVETPREVTTEPEEASAATTIDAEAFDRVMESLYFLQLFAKESFNLGAFVKNESQSKEGCLTAAETEVMESFGKRVFPTVAHLPKDALEGVKEAGKCLLSGTHAEAVLVMEAVAKLKQSEAMERELKLTVHGFPLVIEKEVSDTTERTDKSEEKAKQEAHPSVESNARQETQPCREEHLPLPATHYPSTSEHYMYPVDAEVRPAKGPRPFLPFPQAEAAGESPMPFAMTQQVVGMHSFYTPPPPLPGHFISPAPFHPQQAPPLNAAPMLPAEQQPMPPEELPAESTAVPPEEKTAPPVQTENVNEFTPSTATDGPPVVTTAEPNEAVDPAVPNAHQAVMTEVPVTSYQAKPRAPYASHFRPNSGDRFHGGPPDAGGRGGDFRPWQGRGGGGRYSNNRGPGPMRGRGRGGGRYPYPHGGPPRRPPGDGQHPQSHRPPFMPHQGGERHSYDPRGRQRRGGYPRSK